MRQSIPAVPNPLLRGKEGAFAPVDLGDSLLCFTVTNSGQKDAKLRSSYETNSKEIIKRKNGHKKNTSCDLVLSVPLSLS